jgi:hypothetical protein
MIKGGRPCRPLAVAHLLVANISAWFYDTLRVLVPVNGFTGFLLYFTKYFAKATGMTESRDFVAAIVFRVKRVDFLVIRAKYMI